MNYVLDPASGHYYDPVSSTWAPAGWTPETAQPTPAGPQPIPNPAQVATAKHYDALPQQTQMAVITTEDLAAAREKEIEDEKARKGRGAFFKFVPHPNDGKNWSVAQPVNGVPVKRDWELFFLGPKTPGTLPYALKLEHSFKVDGKFWTVPCNGEKFCWICASRKSLFQSGRAADEKLADSQGRKKQTAIWQFLNLSDPEGHEDRGVMRPWLGQFTLDPVHNSLRDAIADPRIGPSVLDPSRGIPWIVGRSKTKAELNSIKWSIIAMQFRQNTIPPALYGACWPEQMFDVHDYVKPATVQDQHESLVKANFPINPQMITFLEQEKAQMEADARARDGQLDPGSNAALHNRMG